MLANDTSIGVGYAPHSTLERFILDIERTLTSDRFQKRHPWIGTDIKLMGYRKGGHYAITLCVPQIADSVFSERAYVRNLETARMEIRRIAKKFGITNPGISINTRDDAKKGEYYLTAIGSSIESGDEGLVGRGNRINGVISPFQPMSMEGAAGKNPVYHIGKLYYLCASRIAQRIHQTFNIPNRVGMVSQSGRALLDPWVIAVTVPRSFKRKLELEALVRKEIKKIPSITTSLIKRKIRIC